MSVSVSRIGPSSPSSRIFSPTCTHHSIPVYSPVFDSYYYTCKLVNPTTYTHTLETSFPASIHFWDLARPLPPPPAQIVRVQSVGTSIKTGRSQTKDCTSSPLQELLHSPLRPRFGTIRSKVHSYHLQPFHECVHWVSESVCHGCDEHWAPHILDFTFHSRPVCGLLRT